jgi:hypothetical protein
MRRRRGPEATKMNIGCEWNSVVGRLRSVYKRSGPTADSNGQTRHPPNGHAFCYKPDIMKNERAAAAEFALKACSLESHAADFGVERASVLRLADEVTLTEAPEDAVCSLVIDLMNYCQREQIDWENDVLGRAYERLDAEGSEAKRRG